MNNKILVFLVYNFFACQKFIFVDYGNIEFLKFNKPNIISLICYTEIKSEKVMTKTATANVIQCTTLVAKNALS